MNKRNILISAIGVAAIILISGVSYWLIKTDKQVAYQNIQVKKGAITKEIKASGLVKPAEEVALSWEKSGRVTKVNVKVGDQVKAGDVLMTMDSSDLAAQALQAQANVLSAQAVLDQLRNGARPEEIEIKKMELEKGQQDLASYYDNTINTLNDAYAKADEAVRKNTADFFNSNNSTNSKLSFITNNSQLEFNIESQHLLVEQDLDQWQTEMAELANSKDQARINAEIAKAKVYLSDARTYLNEAVDAANAAVNLSTANTNLYKTNATLGRTYVNGAISAVNTQDQLLNTQKLAIERIQKELDLKLAGTRSEDLAAQVARVTQAQAAVDLINVQIAKTILHAPIAGTITKADAQVGEIALPNIPAVALNSNGNFEIELKLSETDIANIKLGDTANVKLDAFGDKNYLATVIAIDPAESTATDGSSGYKTRLQFNENYQELKSGMNANASILVAKKSGVLTLPQGVLIRRQNDYFVLTATNTEKPVQIGLTSADGQVEIISGLSEGETILSVGR